MHPEVLPASRGDIQDAKGQADSEVDAREFRSFLVHSCFSSLPQTPSRPSYLLHSTGVLIAL